MKVESVEVIVARRSGRDGILRWNPSFVRVRTDDGLCGVGEVGLAYGVAASASLGMVKDLAEAFVLKQDPFATERLWETMFRRSFWGEGGGPVVCGAISAIDCALWDIKGKALGVPVWQLLGGKTQDTLRTYASQLQLGWSDRGVRNLVDDGAYADAAAAAVADGYDCVKVDPIMVGLDGQRDPNLRGLFDRPRLRRYRQRMEAIRRGAGPDVDIILELHSFPSASGAQQLAEALADLDILFMEEPVHCAWPQAQQALRRRVGLRLSGGERFYTRWDVAPYLDAGSLDVLQPDFGLVGGITEGKKVCDLAHLHDVTIQGHVCGSPVATAVALQLEAAIPNFQIHEHHVYALQRVNRDLCIEDLQPVKGHFVVPDRPGLGITLNDEALKDCDRAVFR
jgi:L-alanine-DL-glutamate epimerase-like enolase superfamily enzyme